MLSLLKGGSVLTLTDIYRKKKNNYTIDIDEVKDRIESDNLPLDDLIIKFSEAKELS